MSYSFSSWLSSSLASPLYEKIPEGISPQALKRKLATNESNLKSLRLLRRIFLWIAVATLVATVLTAVAYRQRLLLFSNPWVSYLALSVGVLVSLAATVLAIRLAWLISLHYNALIQVRELYKSRLADEIGEGREPDERKLFKAHRQYREDSLTVMEEYRAIARKYKRWHDWFQTIAIIGSVVTSAIATASVYFPIFRWVTIGISLVVGVTTGVNGYYKFRERSFNLQQASDLIEREYHSVALRVGRYSSCESEAAAYRLFAQQVESIRDEQNKRQQQLEQPVETKKEEQV